MDRYEFVLNSFQIGGLVRACHQPIDRLFELSGSVDGIFLPHHVPLGRQYFGPTIPVVSVEQAFAQLFQTV